MAHDLLPHSIKAFETPAMAPAWTEEAFDGKLVFIKCTIDAAIPPLVQHMLVQQNGVKWIVEEVNGSHTAYVSKAQEVVEILVQWADKFEKMKHVNP